MAINTLFQNIADAIRERGSTSDTLTPAQMPQAIRDISRGEEMHKYSTTEQQIGTWINGKPIYEIVIQNTNLSQVIDVSSLNIETIILLDALGANSSGDITNGTPTSGYRWTLTGVSGLNNRHIYLNSDGNSIHRDGSLGSCGAIIIQYTKTTDINGE